MASAFKGLTGDMVEMCSVHARKIISHTFTANGTHFIAYWKLRDMCRIENQKAVKCVPLYVNSFPCVHRTHALQP